MEAENKKLDQRFYDNLKGKSESFQSGMMMMLTVQKYLNNCETMDQESKKKMMAPLANRIWRINAITESDDWTEVLFAIILLAD